MEDDHAVRPELDGAPGPVVDDGSHAHPAAAAGKGRGVPVVIAGAVLALLAGGAALYYRAASATNHVALSSEPKGATAVRAKSSTFRPFRRYVATIDPWVRAAVGPQLVAAYVDTVLVRPGAAVKRGDVLAAVAASARALDAKRAALAKESQRISSLLDGGFVSPNEVDQKSAEVASMEAQLAAAKAQLAGRSLEVNDCVLRAPFDGEISERMADPGAFVRPGQSIVTVVDRETVRITVEVPETDFEIVPPGTEVSARLLATGKTIKAKVSRRAPSADLSTRTVHVEMDIADPGRTIPVGTSAELRIEVGEPAQATEVPLIAAAVKGSKATVCVVDGGVAHFVTVPLLGERDGALFLDPKLAAGSLVVTEGRALLNEKDPVNAMVGGDAPAAAPRPAESAAPSGSTVPASTGSPGK
jgi:RND family efflux transporter MFP subunit